MKVKDKNLASHCQKRTYGLKEKYFFASYVVVVIARAG